MKYLFILLMISLSTIVKAENIYEDSLNFIKDTNKKEQESKILKNIWNDIEGNNVYNDSKKKLLKQNSILIYKSIYDADSKKKLLKIAKESFIVSTCTAFHFRNNTKTVLSDMIAKILNNDEDKYIAYNKSANFLYSKEMMDKFKSFLPKNISEIETNCK